MSGTLSCPVISFNVPAIRSVIFRLSITQGPAIRTNGFPPPILTEPTWTTLFFIGDQLHGVIYECAALPTPALRFVPVGTPPSPVDRTVLPSSYPSISFYPPQASAPV